VTSETTTQQLRTQLRNGWLGSIAIHGLLFLSFLPLFRPSPMTVPTEPFHWDVMLVQSAQTADEPAQSDDPTEPTVSKHPQRAPSPARANHSIQHATANTKRITPLEPQAEARIEPEFRPSSLSSAASPTESTVVPPSNEPMPNSAQESDPPLHQTEPQINSTPQEPSLPPTATVATEGSTSTTSFAQPSPALATASDSAAVSATRLDYGWLQQAIFKRLEELKRSSRPLLDQSQPLKVMVKAVVSREGTLLDSSVAKSSGLDHIDQEAMALVQRAFPMQLDRTLDRQQIVMRIPITYSRE
jgi:TonB family protein